MSTSDMKLPFRFEKNIEFPFVTPGMHGIRHSMVKQETDINFSVIFFFWDKVFEIGS
jgi:sterol desaturase/sphingolipid hydroxylase (fatty acid hydroxylase superfamily)